MGLGGLHPTALRLPCLSAGLLNPSQRGAGMFQYSALPWGSGYRGGQVRRGAWGCHCRRGLTPDLSPAALEECRSIQPEQSLWFLPRLWPAVMLAVNRVRDGRPPSHPPLLSPTSQRPWGQTHLLQHERLLLLEQGLQLWGRQDLLHLLGGKHLRRHHGHRHRHLWDWAPLACSSHSHPQYGYEDRRETAGFKFWLCHLRAVCLWTSDLPPCSPYSCL